MIGDIVVSDGEEFEVVWAGGEGLIPDRETKIIGSWTAPPRLYNKTGKYSKKSKVDKIEPVSDPVILNVTEGD